MAEAGAVTGVAAGGEVQRGRRAAEIRRQLAVAPATGLEGGGGAVRKKTRARGGGGRAREGLPRAGRAAAVGALAAPRVALPVAAGGGAACPAADGHVRRGER